MSRIDQIFVLNQKNVSKILYIEMIFVLLYSFFVQCLSLPKTITYLLDVLNILCFIYILCSKYVKSIIRYLKMKPVILSIVIFVCICLFSDIINKVSPSLILWASRNNYRFFIFFIAMVCFLKKNEFYKIEKIIIGLYFPNFILSLLQFFVLGLKGDNLGGIFGNSNTNALTNAYLCIVIALILQKYFRKKKSFLVLVSYLMCGIIIASLAELKIFFIELPIIVGLSFIQNKLSMKSILLVILCFSGLYMGISMLLKYFPQWTSSFESLESLIRVGNNVGGGYRLSRIGGIQVISQNFFHNDLLSKLFGLGFGNCEYSSFSFFTSSFYKTYGSLNYRWFMHLNMFLECGYMGVIGYIGILVANIYCLWNLKINCSDEEGYAGFGIIICIIMILLFFYNSTLREEPGYMVYFALAMPYAYYNNFRPESFLKS